jgi:AraC-like DNA-binding protein
MKAPSFDTWTIIFLITAVQGLFVATAFYVSKKRNPPNRWLAYLMLLMALSLFEYVAWWTRYIYFFPHLIRLSHGIAALFGPVLYFYFREVFLNRPLSRRDWVHFIPFLVFQILDLPFILQSTSVKQAFLQNSRILGWEIIWLRDVYPFALIATFLFYWVQIRRQFGHFSRSAASSGHWFGYLNWLYTGFVVAYASYFILVRTPYFNPAWDYGISFAMSFFIYTLSWIGYLQPQVFNGLSILEAVAPPSVSVAFKQTPAAQNINEKYRSSSLTPSAAQELAERLDMLMREKKWYLESELSLDKLAALVGTSKHSVSQVINEKIGMNFFDYINSLRIAEAARLLAEKSKKELTIIEIAYQVGFNNKVTFNNTFKKFKHMTPTEYRQQRQN